MTTDVLDQDTILFRKRQTRVKNRSELIAFLEDRQSISFAKSYYYLKKGKSQNFQFVYFSMKL